MINYYPFLFSAVVAGGGTYEYGQEVLLACIVIGESGSYNFTWETPVGSSSLERGTISSDVSFITLTFEAREEDSGAYTCRVLDSTGESFAAHVTIGNTLLQST